MIKRFAALSVLLIFISCSGERRPLLTITGSSTVAPVAAELARRFEQLNPNIRVDVQTGGSSRGLADVRNGLADIGMMSKSVSETDVTATLLALDGLAIILHESNPVEALSDAQIVDMYRGNISRWADTDIALSPVHKADGRSTQQVFLKHFKLQANDIRAAVIVGDNEQGIKTVAATPGAIGYVSIGAARYAAANGVAIKLLPLNGIAASVENVRNGSYPLARELNWVTAAKPTGIAAEFMDFAATDTGREIIRSLYFVPAR